MSALGFSTDSLPERSYEQLLTQNTDQCLTLESLEAFVAENGPSISHLSLEKFDIDPEKKQSLVKLTPNITSISFKALMGPTKIQIPLGHCPAGPRNMYGYTDILMAAENGFTDLVEILIQRGRDVNQEKQLRGSPEMGETPLFFAVKNGHHDVAKLLLENGAKVNAFTLFRNTPLLTAAENGDEKIVELLLSHGADLNQCCAINEFSALHLAAEKGHEKLVELLIRHGANINQLSKEGWTPLMLATQNNHEKIISLLLKYKTDIYQKSKSGSSFITLLKMARPRNWQQIKEQIQQQRISSSDEQFTKQFMQTKLLSHAFGIDRLIDIQGIKIKGSGSSAEFAAAKIAKSIRMFSAAFPNLLDMETIQKLVRGIQMLADQNSLTADDYLESVRKGEPTFILTGYDRHSVTVLIWDDLLVICNRGSERLYYPAKFGRIDPSKLDKAAIQQFIDMRTQDKNYYHDNIIGSPGWYQGSLLEKIKFKGSLANDIELSKLASLPWQTIGNCTWANMEQAIMCYLLLARIRENGFNLFSNPDKNKILGLSTYLSFNCWLLFQKIILIKKHITSGFDPIPIVPHVFENLRSELTKVFVDMAPIFAKTIDAIEKLYLERVSVGPASSSQTYL